MMSWVCDFTRLALRWQLEHGSHTSLPGKTSYFADAQPAAHLPVHDALGPGQRYIYFYWGCLFDAYPMPIRRLSDAYPTAIRCLSDGYPMPIWRLSDGPSDGYPTATQCFWYTFITYPMGIRCLSDGHPGVSGGYPMSIEPLAPPIWNGYPMAV